MKAALCLHGLFDSSVDISSTGLDGYNHIKKNILDVIDTDVFVHSWETEKMKTINKLYLYLRGRKILVVLLVLMD